MHLHANDAGNTKCDASLRILLVCVNGTLSGYVGEDTRLTRA